MRVPASPVTVNVTVVDVAKVALLLMTTVPVGALRSSVMVEHACAVRPAPSMTSTQTVFNPSVVAAGSVNARVSA
jgi:hypothetical protein